MDKPKKSGTRKPSVKVEDLEPSKNPTGGGLAYNKFVYPPPPPPPKT